MNYRSNDPKLYIRRGLLIFALAVLAVILVFVFIQYVLQLKSAPTSATLDSSVLENNNHNQAE